MERIHVLVIEDNPADVWLIREALRDLQQPAFTVASADRLAAGIRQVQIGSVDVVLLDLQLPDSIGAETLVQFLTACPKVPVIVFTGGTDGNLGMEAMRQGAQDYLVKGRIEGEGLARAIQFAIERKRTEETLRRNAEIQTALREIAEAALLLPSLNDLYEEVYRLVERILPAKNFFIALLDETAGQVVVPYCVDEMNALPQRRPAGKGLTEYVIRMRRAVQFSRKELKQLYEAGEVENLHRIPIEEWMGAPLTDAQGKAFGVIALFTVEDSLQFLPADSQVLSIIATQVSLAIERKRAADAIRVSEARYHALMEQSFEALAVVDIEKKEIVEVNRRFTELFGYSLPEDAPLTADKYMIEPKDQLEPYFNAMITTQHVLLPEVKIYRHKNGSKVYGERAGSVIKIDGRDYLLGSMRDMTAERRRQAEMIRDLELARRVQRQLLPVLPKSAFVEVRTVYYPSNVVSGDSYHLEYRHDGTVLRGFLVDVSGHGLGTALQTASINSLLREDTTAKLPLLGQMRSINARAEKYFTDGAYAAIIGFELDLTRRELSYVGAGITQFYANGKRIETPGMFIGMWEHAEFTAGKITIAPGDTFYFLTDGFTDALVKKENGEVLSADGNNFDADVAGLERLGTGGGLRDDATGVCLRVTDFVSKQGISTKSE